MGSELASIERLDPEMAAVLRSMSGAERLRIASEMYSAARRMLTSHLEASHPEWSKSKTRKEVSRRLSRGTG